MCATCHDASARTAVKTAIANHDKSCGACHGTGHSVDLGTLHAASPANASITYGAADLGTHACSECHAPLDLRTLHGVGEASCAKCHTVSVKTTLGGSGWNKSCVQVGCHPAGPLAMHGSISASHTADVASGCTSTTGCHTGGGDVAVIHMALGRSDKGCPICHAGPGAPTTFCATPGCHGATDSHPVAAAHLADHKWCNDCHQSNWHDDWGGPTVSVDEMCVSCHGPTFTPLTNAYVHPWCHGDTNWTGNDGCAG